tara:strand:- start:59 stop:550 length:492 start_codon:yes stop_codon:yes gene_type:complete
MIIELKNKYTLKVDDFQFRCSIGKGGIKKNKKEGDKCTPKGIFKLSKVYYRADRIKQFSCPIKKVKIQKDMGWCDDPKDKYYNKLVKIHHKIKCEKLYRNDRKYDYLIHINHNTKKIVPFNGSAIFLHLTSNYKPTAGCVAIKKNDMEILLKIIKRNTFIKIF